MKIVLFTVEKANRVVREVGPRLEELMALHRDARQLEARLDVMSLALAGASASNPDAGEARRLVTRRAELTARIRKGIDAIQSNGCLVKDLEQGLLDFYSLAGDRLIFLCWRFGEREVTHWHTLEGGFASRRSFDKSPLEDQEGR